MDIKVKQVPNQLPEILFLKKGTHKNHGMFSSNGKRINLICIPKSLNTKFKRLYFVKKMAFKF